MLEDKSHLHYEVMMFIFAWDRHLDIINLLGQQAGKENPQIGVLQGDFNVMHETYLLHAYNIINYMKENNIEIPMHISLIMTMIEDQILTLTNKRTNDVEKKIKNEERDTIYNFVLKNFKTIGIDVGRTPPEDLKDSFVYNWG